MFTILLSSLLLPSCGPDVTTLADEAAPQDIGVNWFYDGTRPTGYLGHALAIADIDGDGDGDLVVGAPGANARQNPKAGAVYVFYTEDGRPEARPSQLRIGREAYARFGDGVANAGDIDGDGADEVLVTSPSSPGIAGPGYIALLDQAPSGALRAVWEQKAQRAAPYGFERVAVAAGDVNGDGYADIAVGDPGFVSLDGKLGALCIYQGGPAGLRDQPDDCRVGPTPDVAFGKAVAAVGDVDGDGYDDVMVGAPDGKSGAVYIFPGGAFGIETKPFWQVRGPAGFGTSLAGLGDLGEDGADDFAVGSPEEDAGTAGAVGAVYVYTGRSPSGEDAHPMVILRTAVVGERFGAGMVAADFDADGRSELVVSRQPNELADHDAGTIEIFAFDAGGSDVKSLGRMDGLYPGEHYGFALAAGDVDGNPDAAEILVGVPGRDTHGTDAGAVELVTYKPYDEE